MARGGAALEGHASSRTPQAVGRCLRDKLRRLIPDVTTLWVVFFLLLCTFVLNTLVFQPILRVMDARVEAVRSGRELAEAAAQKAAAAAAEYDRKLGAARAEVYQQMDEMRRRALDRRAELLAATRASVEQELATALARVRQEAAQAREALDREAAALAGAIVGRVLGRAPSDGASPGTA